MRLLGFQREAVDAVVKFAGLYAQLSQVPALADSGAAASAAWTAAALPAAAGRPYSETRAADDRSVPTAAIVLPTGGGKTITGACAGIEVGRALGHPGQFLVWMVPSDAIFDQTANAFGPGGWLEAAIRQEYGLQTNLKTADSVWSDSDFRLDALTVLLVSMQSLVGDANVLRFYRSADRVAGLSIWLGKEVDPSLASLLEETQPVFIIDEAHKVYTESGRGFFSRGDYASFVVELTATPKPYSSNEYPNIAYAASAAQLVEESLLKNPLEYHLESSSPIEVLLAKCIQQRDDLEHRLQAEFFYTPPKVLLSGSFTHERHRAHEQSAQSIKQQLIDLGVEPSQIAIKSASLDEIGESDLDSPESQIRYVITSRALAEGWDVKSVFIVALLNSIGAPLTTFQLVGRGLRQPNREYFSEGDLNRLHVYSNSITHDEAVGQLRSFLDSEGLTGLWVDIIGPVSTYEMPLPPSITVPEVRIRASDDYKRLWLVQSLASRMDQLSLDELLFRVSLDASTMTLDLGQEGPSPIGYFSPAGSLMLPPEAWRREFLIAGSQSLAPVFRDSREVGAYLTSQYEKWLDDSGSERLYSVPPLIAVREVLQHLKGETQSLKSDVFFNEVLPEATVSARECPSRSAIPMAFSVPDPPGVMPFTNCVFGDFPKSLLDGDERDFARFLDSLQTPWFRNPSQRGWYELPLLDGHMYPDFGVLLGRHVSDALTFTRIILVETKGAHLLGNEDSERKKRLCNDVTQVTGGRVTALFGSFEAMRVEVLSAITSDSGDA